MTHPRTNIRNALADTLRETFDNVYTSRAVPLFDQDLPAILVYTTAETIKKERWDMDGFGPLTRTATFGIEAVAIGKATLDDELDELAEKIESAMDGWVIPNYNNAIIRFISTEIDMSVDGNKTYGAIRLEFTITYFTDTTNDDT